MNTPNKEGLDATQKLWSSSHPQCLADTLVRKLLHASGWEIIERHVTHYRWLLLGPLRHFQAFARRFQFPHRDPKWNHWCNVYMNLCDNTSLICPTQALLLCMAQGEPPGNFILMATTIVLSAAKSPLVISMGDAFS